MLHSGRFYHFNDLAIRAIRIRSKYKTLLDCRATAGILICDYFSHYVVVVLHKNSIWTQ